MNSISTQIHKTPYGDLILGAYKDRLVLCDWQYRKMRAQIDSRIQKGLGAVYMEEDSNIIQDTIKELNKLN